MLLAIYYSYGVRLVFVPRQSRRRFHSSSIVIYVTMWQILIPKTDLGSTALAQPTSGSTEDKTRVGEITIGILALIAATPATVVAIIVLLRYLRRTRVGGSYQRE